MGGWEEYRKSRRDLPIVRFQIGQVYREFRHTCHISYGSSIHQDTVIPHQWVYSYVV